MDTTRCPYCGGEIQPEAIKCRHCRADLVTIHYTPADKGKGNIALALISFLLIVYTILASIASEELDKGGMASLALLAQIALVTGVVSVSRGMGLRRMAIASIVLSGITSFVLLGILGEF